VDVVGTPPEKIATAMTADLLDAEGKRLSPPSPLTPGASIALRVNVQGI